MKRRQFLVSALGWGAAIVLPARAWSDETTSIIRTPLQYIAALGEPTASSGTGAEHWGIWRDDPGPRGVRLKNYDKFAAWGGVAPAGWAFDPADWWLEENGLIMEAPAFPLKPGKYLVTGGREVSTLLTVHPNDDSGISRWELGDGATLHDVTHLGCRSARYKPEANGAACTPANALQNAFRVTPGAAMPPVPGCTKQDYHVLFVIGVGVDKGAALLDDLQKPVLGIQTG